MSVRIIAGDLRGRRIELPREVRIRPTPDRAKVALFNSIAPVLYRSRVLDLCAGTGALGIECLSRGAERAVFVEEDARVARLLADNLARLGLAERSEVIRAEALRWLDRCPEDASWDLVLADPPYASELLSGITERLAARPGLVAEDGWVVLEDGGQVAPSLPANRFELRWRRQYGGAHISVFHRTDEGSE